MNNEKMPRTPFSTTLSGTAKETQARLKNIFSGPKKRAPVLLVALTCAVCLLCGNLVACQSAGAEQDPDAQGIGQKQTEQTSPAVSDIPKQALPSGLDRTPDLNGNSVPETLKLTEEDDGDLMLEVWENGEIILQEPGEFAYPSAEFLCTLDGQDYLLRYKTWGNQGNYYYYGYELASFTGEFEETVQWNSVDFDTNFAAPFHKEFDPESIAALVEQVNELLPNCELLFCTSPDLAASFERVGQLEDDLNWLDAFPAVFTRDPDRSLLDNLRDFQSAMTAAYPPETGTPAALPLDQPLEMEFYSGAGAWGTTLTLNPDGTFTGDYSDADGSICYVCQFHGNFGQFRKLTDVSWSMEVEKLALDTQYPVGTEWDEGGIHYISSEPHGFTDGAGIRLEPGARFLLYTPQASNESLDGELYGATDFLSWYHGPRSYHLGETGPMDCYGLYNLEGNIGFFS